MSSSIVRTAGESDSLPVNASAAPHLHLVSIHSDKMRPNVWIGIFSVAAAGVAIASQVSRC